MAWALLAFSLSTWAVLGKPQLSQKSFVPGPLHSNIPTKSKQRKRPRNHKCMPVTIPRGQFPWSHPFSDNKAPFPLELVQRRGAILGPDITTPGVFFLERRRGEGIIYIHVTEPRYMSPNNFRFQYTNLVLLQVLLPQADQADTGSPNPRSVQRLLQ